MWATWLSTAKGSGQREERTQGRGVKEEMGKNKVWPQQATRMAFKGDLREFLVLSAA